MYGDGFPCSRGQALTGLVAGPTHRYRWECLSERRETGRRETGDGRPGTGDRRPETGAGGRGRVDGRRETGDGRRETGDGETGDRRRETGDGRLGDWRRGTGDRRRGDRSPVSGPPSPVPRLRSPVRLRSPFRLRSPVPRLPSLTHESSRSDARCLSNVRGHS